MRGGTVVRESGREGAKEEAEEVMWLGRGEGGAEHRTSVNITKTKDNPQSWSAQTQRGIAHIPNARENKKRESSAEREEPQRTFHRTG